MIDTHSHLFDEAFNDDRDDIIAQCHQAGITKIIAPAVDFESYNAMESLCDKYPNYIYPTMGLHPEAVKESWEEELQKVKHMLYSRPERYVAVGEIGLDLYWSTDFHKQQCDVLTEQVMWSLDLRKPLILHVRKAYDEIFPVLDPFAGKLRGVFHSFEGEERDIERISRLGNFYIGVGGIATYKKRIARLLASTVPLERIVLETDSPYLTPAPLQGTRNSSLNLKLIVKKLSEVYSKTEEEIISVTTRNALKLFFE